MFENKIIKQFCGFAKQSQPKLDAAFGLGILTDSGVVSELPIFGRSEFKSYTIDDRNTMLYVRRESREVQQFPTNLGASEAGGEYSFEVPLAMVLSSPNNTVPQLLAVGQQLLNKRYYYTVLGASSIAMTPRFYITDREDIFNTEGLEVKANINPLLAVVAIYFTLKFRCNLTICESAVLC